MAITAILSSKLDNRSNGDDCTFNGYLEDYLNMEDTDLDPVLREAFAGIQANAVDTRICVGLRSEINNDAISNQIIRYKDVFKLNGKPLIYPYILYVQKDEEERGRNKKWTADMITPSDLEKVICNGIPINNMGNLKKMSASILARHFSQKRFSRQRITNILNHKFPVERFDLITLEFFIISQEMEDEDPYERYHVFLEQIQEILKNCGMSGIYIVNPYECFLLMCLLTDCPLAVFSEIWEKSLRA